MVTVEADPVHVESRLAAGGIGCPTCGVGVLGGWGYARARQIEGLSDLLRPRRARCRACTVTDVLLPVTVRGWLRRAGSRLEAVRVWFLGVAVAAGVDVRIPDGTGCAWRDVLAAVATATAAIRFRFGAAGLLGAVTPDRVAVAASGGRLLAPGWSSPRS